MSLNPGGAGNYTWHYSNPDQPDFSLELVGTVVAMQERQAREWDNASKRPGRAKFFSSGKPVMNIRMTFALENGSIKTFEFAKAGSKQQSGEKPSVHMDFYKLSNFNFDNLYGRTFKIVTWPANPVTGERWGLNNPRLFEITEVPGVSYEPKVLVPDELKIPELFADDGASGGQANAPQQAPQQAPQMYGQYYASPTPQPVYQQPVYQQPVYQQPAPQPQQYQQPVYQQPQPMPVQQAMQPQMPQGMDPVVAAAMQAVGATNVQPVYEDIPF